MPALILFGASGPADDGGTDRFAQLRVTENATDVVARLDEAKGGLAELTPINKPNEKVWVNPNQVRVVRQA